MFVVIQTGGKQINVTSGQEIFVEKIIGETKDKVIFDKVLMIGQSFGQPFLEGAEVHGKILKQDKEKKIRVFKYKPKKNSKTMYGHRQPYTKVLITDILINGKSVVEKPAPTPTIKDEEVKTTILTTKEPTPAVTKVIPEEAQTSPVVKVAKKPAKKTTKTELVPEDDITKTVISEGNVKTIFNHKNMTVKVISEDDEKATKK